MTTPRALDALARILTRPAQTEAGWQEVVVAWARLRRWLVYHTFDSRHSTAGFPDLVLVRDRIIYAELKTDNPRSKLSTAQAEWRHALEANGAEWHLWRPADWPIVKEVLQ